MPNATGTAATAQVFQTVSGSGALVPAGGGFLTPYTPNILDFLTFLNSSVQIPATALPPTSNWPLYAFSQAMALCPRAGAGILDTLAVYNCATHILLEITPDVPGQNYFTSARSNAGFNLVNPSTGLVAASSDEGTSVTLASPDWAKTLTATQLGFYRTPWGRTYLGYIQSYGPTVVGLT